MNHARTAGDAETMPPGILSALMSASDNTPLWHVSAAAILAENAHVSETAEIFISIYDN
jgi:hypothetical protein